MVSRKTQFMNRPKDQNPIRRRAFLPDCQVENAANANWWLSFEWGRIRRFGFRPLHDRGWGHDLASL
ncbi:hypothetical protein RSSM_00334 [Rhodopirellula sallentina SM41]|uniref:Uncharacterized protein n=1 Tax=Rhodopirellula sallentina SM41 TaxID=1263870 RepID=M5UK63_9BACT|nr:hypothetical protein RSSM_00334 [Rhodopirellula sallentina SM41]